MNSERLQDLWARFLDGHPLTSDEERELLDALRADDSLRSAFLKEARIDGRLRALSASRRDEEAFARRFRDGLAAERDESRFIRKMQDSFQSERTPVRRTPRLRPASAPRNPFLFPALAAAGLVFALLVLFSTGSPSPRPVAPRPAPQARIPVAREPRVTVPPSARPPVGPAVPGPRAPKPEVIPQAVPVPDRARKIEEEMRKAIDRDRPKRSEPARKPRVPNVAPPTRAVAVAAGVLEGLRGRVEILDAAGGRKPAADGLTLASGQGVSTGEGSGVALAFSDGTRIELDAGTTLRSVSERQPRGPGKQVDIASGIVRAEVAKQPLSQPMVFTTPGAEARVLGTSLKLTVSAGRTRLDVIEGKVRLKRTGIGRSVDVVAGHFAVAAEGETLRSRIVPVNDIVLRPDQAELIGAEWKRVDTPGGGALEARATRSVVREPATLVRLTRSHAAFTFLAERGKTYHLWIRGRCLAKTGDPTRQDAVIVEIPGAVITPPDSPYNVLAGKSSSRALFNGWGRGPSPRWVGGDGDFGRDLVPARVRFLRDGTQRINVYPLEVPIQIDALWLSATQEERPDPATSGPETTK